MEGTSHTLEDIWMASKIDSSQSYYIVRNIPQFEKMDVFDSDTLPMLSEVVGSQTRVVTIKMEHIRH